LVLIASKATKGKSLSISQNLFTSPRTFLGGENVSHFVVTDNLLGEMLSFGDSLSLSPCRSMLGSKTLGTNVSELQYVYVGKS